ncbi:hypothetical protein KFL_005610070 [Klebsormidium nitens]|uniref:Uncharacterized protein n=1 Tax=Klebsormidium nitens TaxID=105231 RepID=A0A1Y1IG00_KLENI|nr:hypothetical protein KFL_005610070 [Klebsormidium nitens]|eukprot:GAQ89780.1 hypothetical protein KFL_005610070 [Klebsormidium nitens]
MVWTERNPNGSRVAGKAEIGARWGQSGRSLVEARVRTALEQRLAPGKSSRARPEWSRGRQGASGSPKTDRRHRGGDFEELSPGAAHDQGYIRLDEIADAPVIRNEWRWPDALEGDPPVWRATSEGPRSTASSALSFTRGAPDTRRQPACGQRGADVSPCGQGGAGVSPDQAPLLLLQQTRQQLSTEEVARIKG